MKLSRAEVEIKNTNLNLSANATSNVAYVLLISN